MLSELEKHAAGGPGMKKGDLGAMSARSRLAVDQINARLIEAEQQFVKTFHLHAEVMNARASPLKVFGDGPLSFDQGL